MWRTACVVGLSLACLVVAPGASYAQGGPLIFADASLSADGSNPEWSFSVFANESESPTGTSDLALLNAFDLTTGDFHQCLADTSDLTVGTTKTTLTMIAGPFGSNCAAGEVVTVTCQVTKQTAVFHNVTTGTAKLPVFDQQYSTHGVSDAFNNLACELKAFGVTIAGVGSADRSEIHTTP